MKSGDTPELNWPFLKGEWGSEKSGHVRMKNTAVFLLTAMGISRENVQEELRDGRGSVDIYAETEDGQGVIVECETTHNRWDTGDMYREGYKQYVLTQRGFFEVVGRTYQQLVPVNLQATLTESGNLKGRWFADGRNPGVKIELPPERRPISGRQGYSDGLKVSDEYHRWKANGLEKREEAYSVDELISMLDY